MLKEKTIRISIVQIKSIMTPTPGRFNLLAPSHCFGQLCTLVYIWADIHGHPQMALLSRSNGWGRCCDVIRARAIIPHITHGWRFSGCHARLTATTRWRASFDRHLTGRLNQRTGQMLVYQLCVRIRKWDFEAPKAANVAALERLVFTETSYCTCLYA